MGLNNGVNTFGFSKLRWPHGNSITCAFQITSSYRSEGWVLAPPPERSSFWKAQLLLSWWEAANRRLNRAFSRYLEILIHHKVLGNYTWRTCRMGPTWKLWTFITEKESREKIRHIHMQGKPFFSFFFLTEYFPQPILCKTGAVFSLTHS